MTATSNFDRRLADWLEADGAPDVPAGLVAAAVAVARGTSQRRSPLDRMVTRLTWPAVGLPGARTALRLAGAIALAAALLAALVGAGLLVSGAFRQVNLSSGRVYMNLFVAGRPTSMADAPATAVLRDGRVLLVEGCFCGDPGRAEIYDPATGRFTTTGRLLEPRVGAHLTTLPDGRVLVDGGGLDPYSFLDTVEIYTPSSGTFAAAGTLPGATPSWGPSVSLADGRVLILSASPPVIYSPASGTFEPAAADEGDHRAQGAALMADGRVLLVHPSEGDAQGAEVYDPATRTFSKVGDLREIRTGGPALMPMPDGRVMVVGGMDSATPAGGSSGIANTEVFDPKTGQFSLGPRLVGTTLVAAASVFPFAAVRLDDGRIAVITQGGLEAWNPAGGPSTGSSADPGSGRFSPVAALPPGAVGGIIRSAVALKDGRVLVFIATDTGLVAEIFE